jgi:DNA-binding transcriptional ArsR family regulator
MAEVGPEAVPRAPFSVFREADTWEWISGQCHAYFRIYLIKSLLYYKPMDALTALADPTRRQIVEMLSNGELCAGEIVNRFDMTASAVSQHLKALREAGLVTARVDAQRRIYILAPAGFDEIAAWLNRVRSFWAPRLDALEAALTEPMRTRRKRRLEQRSKNK